MSKSALSSLIEFFIHNSLFEDEFSKGFSFIYTSVCLFTILLTLLTALMLPFSPLTPDQLFNAELIVGLTVLGYLGGLFILRSGGYLVIAINLYSVTVFVNILAVVFLTGGFSGSPQLILLLFIPLWSFVMLDHIYGILASVAVALAVGVLYSLEVQGFEFRQYIPVDAQPYMRLQAWIGLLLIISSCLYIYAHNYNALNQRLSNERSRFAYESLHDPLTGLSNRTLFYKRARAAIDHTLDGELKAGIIYLDVDNFKPINDDLGHEVGDKVLTIIAMRLKKVVRSSDTVARLGGDEFGIVLHGMANKGVATIIAEKIVDAVVRPIAIENHQLQVGASLGVVVAPDNGTQFDDLVRLADNAMYQAKRSADKICFV